jgi:hypothetical protein
MYFQEMTQFATSLDVSATTIHAFYDSSKKSLCLSATMAGHHIIFGVLNEYSIPTSSSITNRTNKLITSTLSY